MRQQIKKNERPDRHTASYSLSLAGTVDLDRPIREKHRYEQSKATGSRVAKESFLGAVADVVEIWMTLSLAFSGYRVMRQRQAFADLS